MIFMPQAPSVITETSIGLNQPTLFDIMDDYSLLGILDRLAFGDLANIGASSQRCQQLIIHHYLNHKYRLNGANVAIILYSRNKDVRISYANNNSSYSLSTGFNEMLSTLKAFCHIFNALTITHDFSDYGDKSLMEQVSQTTNNYCSEIPQTINIDMVSENTQFTFAHAANVDVRSPERHSADELNRIFPQVENLKIHIYESFKLDQYFPHLRHFEAVEVHHGLFDLGTFGKHNPQLRSINIAVSYNQLQQVNSMFPKIETLNIRLQCETFPDSLKSKISTLFGMNKKKYCSLPQCEGFYIGFTLCICLHGGLF